MEQSVPLSGPRRVQSTFGLLVLGLVTVLCLCHPLPLRAQVPAVPVRTPAVVPPAAELAPPRTPIDSSAAVPERKPAARELAKPEDDMRLDVVAYRLDESAPQALRDALPTITAPYTGRQRGFEDLVNAAAELTRYMQRELGYYLGYAYLPEQAPDGGIIRLAVLEGRLDRVVLNWRTDLPVDREVVESYLARLEPGAVLKVRDVERVVFLLNDLRGMTARFEVRAGTSPGTATLVVSPAPEKALTGKAELDINGSKALGEYRLSGLVQMNSPFGRGDGFAANALASTTGGLTFALLGYTTPVGNDGIKLGVSASALKYQLDRVTFPLDLNGLAYTANGYALYPVVRSRNLNLFTLASLDHKQYEDRNINSRARRSVQSLTLGTTGDFRDSVLGGGVNTYDASLVAGRVSYQEGSSSSLDDDASFTKLGYSFTRLQDLVTGRALVYFSLRGQQAANNLDTTEQFRLGGPEGVRAFATGEGTGDIGAVASLELRFLPPEDWLGRFARELVASVFVDTGYVQYRYRPRISSQPNAAKNTATFSGAGMGVTWVQGSDYSLRLSVAKPVSGTPRSGDDPGKVRVYLQASVLFN
jgi:hemolysin activation/secretion protein